MTNTPRRILKRIPRTCSELLPDMVVEIKSAFERRSTLQEKIESFLQQGTAVGLS